MRFLTVDDEGEGASDEVEAQATTEAQEANNQQLYESALALHAAGSHHEARSAYGQLLEQPLVAQAEAAAAGGAADTRRPSLHLRFLALKNQSELEEQQGRHGLALDLLLSAVRIDERDAVLWGRVGALALRVEQKNVARLAFEQAVACSPHHQLAAMRLRFASLALASPSPSPSLSSLTPRSPLTPSQLSPLRPRRLRRPGPASSELSAPSAAPRAAPATSAADASRLEAAFGRVASYGFSRRLRRASAQEAAHITAASRTAAPRSQLECDCGRAPAMGGCMLAERRCRRA